jgi:hypothetical protein
VRIEMEVDWYGCCLMSCGPRNSPHIWGLLSVILYKGSTNTWIMCQSVKNTNTGSDNHAQAMYVAHHKNTCTPMHCYTAANTWVRYRYIRFKQILVMDSST